MSISRRQFLCSAAAGAAAAARGTILQASTSAAETPLQLGLVTYNWGKDWDLPTLLRNCSDAAIAGVELRSTHKHGVEISLDAAARAQVRALFADSDVELVGLGSACEYHAPDPAVLRKNIRETEEFVRLCHDVGGSGVKVRPNGLPEGVPVEQTLEQIGWSLNQVGQFAADFGVQIRLEVHGRGTCEIPHMQQIMAVADHPNVAVCWNCNQEDLKGAGFVENFRSLADRMGTIHIHDLRRENYPWKPLFAELARCDAPSFTGWTLIEEGNVPADLLPAMKANRRLWDALVAEFA